MVKKLVPSSSSRPGSETSLPIIAVPADVTTALAVISETGADMSRFPTAGHFASWLGLCPGTKITGGKVMSGKTRAMCQSGGAGTEAGRSSSAHQPVGTGRVLQTHVFSHG